MANDTGRGSWGIKSRTGRQRNGVQKSVRNPVNRCTRTTTRQASGGNCPATARKRSCDPFSASSWRGNVDDTAQGCGAIPTTRLRRIRQCIFCDMHTRELSRYEALSRYFSGVRARGPLRGVADIALLGSSSCKRLRSAALRSARSTCACKAASSSSLKVPCGNSPLQGHVGPEKKGSSM